MLQETANFEPLTNYWIDELLVAGVLGGASLLATYLFGRLVLQRFRAKIPWDALRLYYSVSAPFYFVLILMPDSFRWLPFTESLWPFLALSIGITQLPTLVVVATIYSLLPIVDWNPWFHASILVILGFLIGRAFVFLLHWLAWSAEPTNLNLQSKN